MKETNETKEYYDGEEEIVLAKAKDEPTAEEEEKEKELPKQEEQTLQKKEKAAVREGEIKELRLENRKVFRMSDGSEQAVFYPEPIHTYDAKTRAYEDIEDTIIESEDKKSFTVGKNRFKASFSNDEESDGLFTVEKDGCRISAVMKRSRKKIKKDVKGHLERINKEDEFKRPKDKLSYKDVGEGADYEYTVNGNGIKENIIIKEKRDVYRYSFILETDNLEYEHLEKDRTVIFRSIDSGKEIFRIPTPFMTDAKGVNSTAVEYEVRKISDGKLSFAVMADSEWINSKSRAFPVIIDPQVIVSQNGNITTYSWDNGYMYTSATHIVGRKVEATAAAAAFSLRGRCITDDWPDNESSGNTGGSCGGNTSGNTGGNSGGNTGGSTGGNNCDGDDCSDTGCNSDDGSTSVDAMRTYINIQIPRLPNNPRIKKAELVFHQKSSSMTGEHYMGIFSTTSALGNGVNSTTAVKDADLIDYVKMDKESYSFDITSLIDKDYYNSLGFCGLVVKAIDEENIENDYIELYGSYSSTQYKPTLTITYESSYAINSGYKTHSHDIGRFGQASVDLNSGNLMFDSEDFAWGGNRMPVTIKHYYNSALSNYQYKTISDIKLFGGNFSNMSVGNGWKLNVMQSMLAYTFINDGASVSGYVYVNGNGEETYFAPITDSSCEYEATDGSGMIYNSNTKKLTVGSETYTFDSLGRLISIEDEYENTMTITFTDGKITSVTDGAERVFTFSYEVGCNNVYYLSSICAPENMTSIHYSYKDKNGNNTIRLQSISYSDGRSVWFTYGSGNKPVTVILKDNGTAVHKVEYEYENSRVSKVTEYGVDEESNFIAGACYEYEYSITAKRTVVTSIEQKDTESGETEDRVIKTVYNFDYDGNVIGEYSYAEDENAVTVYNSNGDMLSNSINLLLDSSFEDYTEWTRITNVSSQFTSGKLETANSKYGKYVLKMTSTSTTCKESGVYQTTVALPAGEYTFSAYMRIVQNTGGAKAYIRVTDTSGNKLAESESITVADTEFIRLTAPFKLTSSKAVKVYILMDGKGTVYADAAQLENNPYASDYNMLDNGCFENGTEGWSTPTQGVSYGEEDKFTMSKSLYITSGLTERRIVSQTVNVKSAVGTRETFTLSGWAKANSLPTRYVSEDEIAPVFRLRAEIFYKGGERESYEAEFSSGTEDWQYTSVQFAKEQYLEIVDIKVFCDYGYNTGNAYFDDIQLIRNSIETGLTADDFDTGESTDTETESYSENVNTEEDTFTELRDKYGNILTETTFTLGKCGTIYRSFAYNTGEEGARNDLVKETDPRGNSTLYTIDEDTSRNEEIIDRCGNKTAYEYDNAGRTTKVTSKDAEGTELAHVSYAYDAFDNMTEIVRGDGMKYALAYNEFHNLESIGIEGKSEALIKYAYKNGNGRLKQMTYANGHTMKAVYNSIGQMVAEKWFETEAQAASSTATPIAHYKYVYDGDGNIVRSIDISGKKEYNYEYEEGRIVRATEADITLSGEIVTSKVIVNTVKYYYDTEGKMTKKVLTPAGGSAQTIYYETSDDNTVVKFSAGGRTVTSHSGTDSFGRKVFDELQLGTDFVSRQFVYHAGKVTPEHKTNAKVKSYATTQLVSQIILSNGTTLSYGYDAEERITSVVETYTVDDTPITNTTLYTYDALGQLLTETVNGEVVNSMEYDNYGNIIEKNGKAYTYGNATWKDLLTGFDGKTIEYDAQGNPVKYLGHTLTWEKGRQLKSFDGNTYTYNANGIRTSKIVNGIKHEYTLDGTKILRETWNGNILIPLYDNEDGVCGILYNNVPYYFIKNLQGDVIAIVDKDAQTVARYSYDSWGVCTVTQDSVGIANVNPFRYRGYYYDEEIELYYLQSRYYDANVGRFVNGDDLGADIIPVEASNNIFSYCDNSPISFYDFYGYKKTAMSVRETLIWGIIGFVVNLIKHGTNIFRIFKKTSATVIEKTILSIMFLLPVNVAAELTNYYVKHFASLVVTLGSSIVVELAALGLNVAKASVVGLAITVACTIALVYLPKLIDSVKMIVYGIKNKNYYWDKKWYGIKYYDKK